jgi:pimeloyl-ACP methyl ester carboxylesterase
VSAVAVTAPPDAPREQTRARYPGEEGYVERDGVRTYYEVYGTGSPTILLLPTWTIFHSRVWKGQIPYLARHFRVVTFDGRGGGRSDRPAGAESYAIEELARDALAVLDATHTERAALVGFSRGAQPAVWLANERPERVLGIAFVGVTFPVSMQSWFPRLMLHPRMRGLAERPLPFYPSWMKFNPNYIRNEYPAFLRWFVARAASDRHSTKLIEDAIAYASETTGDVAYDTVIAPSFIKRRELLDRARAVKCPVLVIHGTKDRVTPFADGKLLARATGAELMAMKGAGHSPPGRYPVAVNVALRRFFAAIAAP